MNHQDVDGSERAVDWFADSISEGEKMLVELARLGELRRPRDTWNARIIFSKPLSGPFDPVAVSERSPLDGRLLRRARINEASSLETPYETTIGNIWRVETMRDGRRVLEVVVAEPALQWVGTLLTGALALVVRRSVNENSIIRNCGAVLVAT